MLKTLEDLSVNLAAAAIGALVVWVWRAVGAWSSIRGSRRLWRPFTKDRSFCITGNISPLALFEDFPRTIDEARRISVQDVLPSLQSHVGDQELSGLMGRGDHDAIVQVQAGLARCGLKKTVTELYESPSREAREANLIVIGGPDVNDLTRTLLDKLPVNFTIARNGRGRNVIRDMVHNHEYEPVNDEARGRIRDYGLLIRAVNPYGKAKSVMILAGAHGFGSLAAATVAFQDEVVQKRLAPLSNVGFECLVCHERDESQSGSAPLNTIVMVRELTQ